MVSLSGLGSGLDTQSIINQLVQVEQAKINSVKARGTKQDAALSSWSTIRSTLTTVRSAAGSLARATDWQSLTATSSDETTAIVSAGSGTMSGTLAFTVDRLAQAGMVRSTNTVTSLTARATTDASLLVAAGGRALGLATVASNDSVSLGTHTISVTQASSAATKIGTTALASSTVIDGTNNTMQFEVGGTAFNITLNAGTYSASDLAVEVQRAATAAGAAVSATVDANGKFELASTSEGSAATLQVTGGAALTAIGLTTDATALTGTDAILSVDGGANQTFGNTVSLSAGSTISISGGGGTITATLAGGLRTGSITANNVSTGDGSLQAVVSAINGAKAGVTAAAIQVGTNTYRLQIGATSSGASSDPSLASSEFEPTTLGGLTTLSQGTDAQITIGSGTGAYSITSSSNVMSNVMPGVSITLKKQNTATPVTVTVSRDGNAIADRIQKLVDAANTTRSEISRATVYNAATRTASSLTGSSTVTRLNQSLREAMTGLVVGANPSTPGLAGVSVDSKGAYVFDKAKFLAAYAADADGTMRVFTQSGSSTSANLNFGSATDFTPAGTYTVNVTRTATQASSTSTGVPAVGTTIRARVGGTIAAYTVQTGDTATTVAAGLNAAFAGQSLGLLASVSGTDLTIASGAYGSRASVDVAWDGSTYTTSSGVDVAGTINGVAATGTGQSLAAPASDATVSGLVVTVTGTTTGTLGTVTYTPGAAARTSRAVALATDSLNGYITSAENAIKSTKTLIDDQISALNTRLAAYTARLKKQFTDLETTISNAKQQGNWLTAQLG